MCLFISVTWYQKNGSKYRAESIVHDGIQYHSKKEAAYAAELNLRLKAHDIAGWQRQIKIPLDITVDGKTYHIADYFIDFIIEHNDHVKEYVEIKGMELPVWRLKWKLFEALYGSQTDIKLTVIK